MRVDRWGKCLQQHPDKEFASFILRGITEGFFIGCNYSNASILSTKSNMPAALAHAEVVTNYLRKELVLSRIAVVPQHALSHVHTSSFGVIPKKNQPGRWRWRFRVLVSDGPIPTELVRVNGQTIHQAGLNVFTVLIGENRRVSPQGLQ